jgi:hypothetical protein
LPIDYLRDQAPARLILTARDLCILLNEQRGRK